MAWRANVPKKQIFGAYWQGTLRQDAVALARISGERVARVTVGVARFIRYN